ncbi:PAS domain-containing protein, partial [Escherichia coli]|nr:PAS domain-containing protein [Escherichia coli]
ETNELWWNEGFQKLFGYKAEDVGNDIASWEARLHPEDAERVIRDIDKHIKSGKTHWADEYRFRRADGTYAFVIDRGYVVYDSEGQPKRMLGSMMDVTDRKNLEQQLTHQALHDPLTKLANRALFRNRVEHAIAKLPRINSS